jgi:FkbM family methyltransferase
MRRRPSFRSTPGRFRRSIFGAVGLRRAAAQHSVAEGLLLRKFAARSLQTVEIGVAEGGSAWEAAQVMPQNGELHLIDPYFRARTSIASPAQITARRLVRAVARGRVHWIRQFSHDARSGWTTPIDLLFIDGDHSYDGIRRDWDDWTPLVREGGHVALHDAHPDAGWTRPEHGPVRLLEEVRRDGWRIVEYVDSLTVLGREADMGVTTPTASTGGRVAWCDDHELTRQLPARYRACAGYFRFIRRLQPRRITEKGHYAGGSFLVRVIASASRRLGVTNRLVLRVGGAALVCDMSEPRTLTIIDEARGRGWQDAFLRSVLAPGDTFLDVGANGGGMTALACGIVQRPGAVFAVEPQPHLAALVRQTLDLNAAGGRVFETAAGERSGAATLMVPVRRSGSATLSCNGAGHRIEVSVTRLDELVAEMGERHVTLLKIDVEGHELGALKGAEQLLARQRPTILFELNVASLLAAGQSPAELLAWLEQRGYAFAEADAPGMRLQADQIALQGSRDLIAHPA